MISPRQLQQQLQQNNTSPPSSPRQTASSSDSQIRILFITLEFAEPYLFSGNGVYARSFVHNLVRLGQCRVLVLCGRPAGIGPRRNSATPSTSSSLPAQHEHIASSSSPSSLPNSLPPTSTSNHDSSRVEVKTVALPTWYRLDRDSSWREFGDGVRQYASDVTRFQPDIILGVDWTSRQPTETLRRIDAKLKRIPFIYCCFRVFSNPSPGMSADDRAFYALREAETLQIATRTIALSRYDAKSLASLRALSFPSSLKMHHHGVQPSIVVIPPLLRDEVRAAAIKTQSRFVLNASLKSTREKWSSMSAVYQQPMFAPTSPHIHTMTTTTPSKLDWNGGGIVPSPQQPLTFPVHNHRAFANRIYITCCARISPEKEVMRFVEICSSLVEFFKQRGLVPYLVGPPTDTTYARRVYQVLKRAFPGDTSVIVSDFVPPEKLQAIFSKTALNIHPAEREPFGMTIVEAAVFGAPSMLHRGGMVGASDVLSATDLCCLTTDMTVLKTASASIRSALKSSFLLDLVGTRARDACLEKLSTKEHANAVKEVLTNVLGNGYGEHLGNPSSSVHHVSNGGGGGVRNQGEDLDMMYPPSPPLSSARRHHPTTNNNVVDEAYPWLALMEWVASSPTLRDGIVMRYDLDAVKLVVEQLITLPPYGLASALKIQQDDAGGSGGGAMIVTDEMYRWGEFFLKMDGSSLGAARYRLVPSRISEEQFWRAFFAVVRDGIIRLLNTEQRQQQQQHEGNGIHDDSRDDNKGVTKIHNEAIATISRLERLVQRDEGARGISTLVQAAGSMQLYEAASMLLDGKRVCILTGFPCVDKPAALTPQETDGPPGAVEIARACVAIGKRVSLVVEDSVSSVVRACLESQFEKSKVLLLRGQTDVTRVTSYGKGGEIQLEVFPVTFSQQHHHRLHTISSELQDQNGVLVAIERAGPCRDGSCRTMRGRAMTRVAPLHDLFLNKGDGVCTIGIGDGGNEVGMGKVLSTVEDKIVMGKQMACVVGCDALLACSVSNWGGYALACAVCVLAMERGLFHPPSNAIVACLGGANSEHVQDVIKAAVRVGACDGVTGLNTLSVDGLPLSKSVEVYESLRRVVMAFARDVDADKVT